MTLRRLRVTAKVMAGFDFRAIPINLYGNIHSGMIGDYGTVQISDDVHDSDSFG